MEGPDATVNQLFNLCLHSQASEVTLFIWLKD